MMDGQDQKGPTPCALRHHGDEAGVGRAVVVVLDAPRDRHPHVPVPLGGRLPKNKTELGVVKRRRPGHLEGQEVAPVQFELLDKRSED